ncbi:hypothetical protein [Coleofasciculus sp. H7-2]|uniref:hypothetical protein n=1 Tax=Coleofasciculus sp. H7-2 TaxID=3351545 RepID=UPI00366D977B
MDKVNRIIKFMGNTSNHLSDAEHFLGLNQLSLSFLEFWQSLFQLPGFVLVKTGRITGFGVEFRAC